MVSKINDLPNTQVQQAGEGRNLKESPHQTEAPQTGKPEATSDDTVTLTPAAQQLNQLQETIANQPVVDTQRVEQIRSAIEGGHFQIDPVKVAEKLMQFEESL
jgi:negative regulator of flagellin synthesis FlgM